MNALSGREVVGEADLSIFIERDTDKRLTTDSRGVAIAFKKNHKDVLRTIERMRRSEHTEISGHYGRNFAPVDFVDAKGERRPMYRMTEKGFAELAMSFTGDLARVTRIRFLNAFEEMAAREARRERSITEQLHDHDRRAVASETRARIGSILMHGRRKEKPALKDEEARLREIAQPGLPLVLQAH